jgi:signal transduction histidine kinase
MDIIYKIYEYGNIMFVFDSELESTVILFINDELKYTDSIDIISGFLCGLVKKLYIATSFDEAEILLKDSHIDIIITELDLDTTESRFMRLKLINNTSPILLITQQNDAMGVKLAIEYGLDQFIIKPIDKDALTNQLNKIEILAKQKREIVDITYNLKVANAELEEKTKELEELNKTLEDRVKEEIGKNREKDHIMFQQARLASMGEMIGNIAHQWRQPLATLNVTLSGIDLRNQLGDLDSDFLSNELNDAKDVITHMNQTINDFRNFFKPHKDREKFSILDSLSNNLKFLEASFKSNNIEIINLITIENDVTVDGFKNELAQAVLNILNNAKDIILQRDTEIKKVILDLDNDGGYIYLSIKDSGGGIEDDIIYKIFEPYFTTKHQSQGTGIGLYMTKQIIETNMSGEINVENDDKEFKGAKFTLKIPIN